MAWRAEMEYRHRRRHHLGPQGEERPLVTPTNLPFSTVRGMQRPIFDISISYVVIPEGTTFMLALGSATDVGTEG